LVGKLEREASTAADGGASARAKAEQNRQRLHTFTAAPPAQTLATMREQVATYLAALPPVAEGHWLFGERISSADVVVAVLCARLSMAAELALLQRADLQAWWQRVQQRSSFSEADVWTRFRKRRFIEAVLAARHTPITP